MRNMAEKGLKRGKGYGSLLMQPILRHFALANVGIEQGFPPKVYHPKGGQGI